MTTIFDAGTYAATRRRIGALTPDHRPRWGRMSVGEMVCHLADYLRMALGQAEAAPVGNALTAAIARTIYFRLPLRFPKNARTLPVLTRTRPDDFRRDVAALTALLAEFVDRRDATEWPQNPLFGRLSGGQWATLVHRHTDHHLRQFGV